MKGLMLKYKNDDGKIITKSYNTIIDFIDEMESDNIDIPMLDYEIVEYVFFEKFLNNRYFATIDDILEFCKGLLNGDFKGEK